MRPDFIIKMKGVLKIMNANIEVPQIEMPKYKCHKIVYALQIAKIEYDAEKAAKEGRETDGSAIIIPVEQEYAPFKVDHAYLYKHKPSIGGYYVVYKDGYKSFSPEGPFKDGYTALKEMNNIEQFEKDLGSLINKYSIENSCDIPDFLLAKIITNIIINTGPIFKKVLDWHGCDSICHPHLKTVI